MTEQRINENGQGSLLSCYQNEGIKLVRVSRATKKPVDGEWQTREVSPEKIVEWRDKGGNVGWQLGEISDWRCAVDLDCPEALRLAPRFLPKTLTQCKGSGLPSIYIYRSVGLGFTTFKDLDGHTIMDLKASNNGAGHQVVVEPSIHPEKGPYKWVGGFNPAAITEVPKEQLRDLVSRLAVAALVGRHLPDKGRHDLALALAGYLLRNGFTPGDVLKLLLAAWEARDATREALQDLRGIVRDTAARIERNEPSTGGRALEQILPGMPARIAKFLDWERSDLREQSRRYMRTDLGNAERFVDMHRDRVRWCPARKSFLVWDGNRWAWDEKGEVVKLAHQTARSIFNEAAHTEDEAEQKKVASFASISQNTNRIKAMLTEAKPYLFVGMQELDQDPWLVNCLNGTLDLRTGRLKDHDPADHITKLVPVDYEPEADCPRFKVFLKEALVDNALVAFVKRYSGYTLTGITRERLVAILWGSGKNGKTTLVEVLHDVLGDYARNTDVETILAKRHAGVGNDVAALKGARFVSCAEVERGRRLAESKVKQLTGNDTVTARFLFGEPFDFRPQFKLWVSTNNKPEIHGTDDAIWDRIRLIPFTQRFDGDRQDPKLPEKLREELPGVFAWMVAGCLEWQEHGLGEPDSVRAATEQYRAEMDTLAAFIADRCVVGEGLSVLAEQLYHKYALWCDANGERQEPQKAFVARLSERRFERKRETRGVNRGRYVWRGIGLHDGGTPPDTDDEGSQREPRVTFGSHQESGIDKQNSGSSQGASEPSEPKNQNLRNTMSREEEDSGSGFTGFTGFTKEGGTPIDDLLRDPPEWLSKQVEGCRNDRGRWLKATSCAIAQHVYKTGTRWKEVEPVLERWLERGRRA